jgi:hypothetical protein
MLTAVLTELRAMHTQLAQKREWITQSILGFVLLATCTASAALAAPDVLQRVIDGAPPVTAENVQDVLKQGYGVEPLAAEQAEWPTPKRPQTLEDITGQAGRPLSTYLYPRPVVVLYVEPGGTLRDHVDRFRALARSDLDIEIRRVCTSACTLITAYVPKERLCFSEQGSLGFHLAWNRETKEPDIEASKWMLNQYPQDIRLWLRDKGGVEKMTLYRFWTLKAEELWAMGYQKCAG